MSTLVGLVVKLSGDISDYERNMSKAGGIAQNIGGNLMTVGKIAAGAAAAGFVALGAGIASTIGPAADFESQMAILSTAVDSSAGSLDDLRKAALAVGGDTALVGVSASGAAVAMTDLYKAGLSTTEIFGDMQGYMAGTAELSGALRASIDLAAASELEMADASKLAAVTLATFGGALETEAQRAEFINDAMNNFVQVANSSAASVSGLADALINVGPTVSSLGISLEDTNTALGILADRGIQGAEAGTALKSMLVNMMRQTPAVTGALKDLNVELFDSEGKMRALPDILGDLEQALFGTSEKIVAVGGRTAEQNHQLDLAEKAYKQATDAIYKHNAGIKVLSESSLEKYVKQQAAATDEIERLKNISGTTTTVMSKLTDEQRAFYIQTLAGTYGMNALNALLQEGSEGWEELEKAIADAATIQEVAAARTATFAGAMEAFDGVIETVKIQIGSALLPALTSIVRVVADFVSQSAPPFLDALEKIGTTVGELFDGLASGERPILAIAAAIKDLGEKFGASAMEAGRMSAVFIATASQIWEFVAPVWNAITAFFSWRDVLSAFAILIAAVVVPAILSFIASIAPIIAAVGLLIAAVALLRNAWETNFAGIQQFVEGVWVAIQTFVAGVVQLFSGDITGALATFWSAIQAAFGSAATFLGNIGEAIETAIFTWLGAKDWSGVASILWTGIADALGTLYTVLMTAWDSIETAIFDWLGVEDWSGVAQAIWDGIVDALVSLYTTLLTAWDKIETAVLEWVGAQTWNEVGQKIWDGIVNGLTAVYTTLSTAWDKIETSVFDWLGAKNWNEVGQKIWDGIVGALNSLATTLETAWANFETTIFNWLGTKTWGETAQAIWDEIVTGLNETATALETAWENFETTIFNWVGANSWSEVATNIWGAIEQALTEFKADLDAAWDWIETSAFNWADANDWSGVGEKIVGGIDTAVQNARNLMDTGLQNLQDKIFEWAGTDNWKDTGILITEKIGGGMADLVQGIPVAITDWITQASEWVDTVEWGDVGYAVMEMIFEGFDRLKDILTTGFIAALGWLNTVKEAVLGIDWKQLGTDIVAAIIAGFELNEKIKQAIKDFLKGMWDFIAGPEGIDAHSPSKKYIPLGEAIPWGMAVGIRDGAYMPVDELLAMANEVNAEGAKAFAEAVTAVVDAIMPAIDVLMQLMAMQVPEVRGRIIEWREQIQALVENFAVGAWLMLEGSNGHGLDLANEFSAATDAVTGAMMSAMEALAAMEAFKMPQNVEPTMQALVEAVGYLVGALVEVAAQIEADGLAHAQVFSDAAGKLIGLVKPALDALGALGEYTRAAGLDGLVVAFALDLQMVIAVLATILDRMTDEVRTAVAAAAQISGDFKALVDLIKPGIESLQLLSEYTRATGLDSRVVAFALDLQMVVAVLGAVFDQMTEETREAVAAAAEMTGHIASLAGIVQGGIIAVEAVAGYVRQSYVPMFEAARGFATDLLLVVGWLANAFGTLSEELVTAVQNAGAMAGAINALASVVEPGIKAIELVSGYIRQSYLPLFEAAHGFMIDLRLVVGWLAQGFGNTAQDLMDAIMAAGAMAAAINGLASVVEPGIKAIELVSGYIRQSYLPLFTAAQGFMIDLRLVVGWLAQGFANTAEDLQEAIVAAGAMAGAINAIASVVQPGIDAIAGIVAYARAANLQEQTTSFTADLVAVARTLASELTGALAPMGEAVDAARDLAGDITGIVGVVGPGVDALASIAEYTRAEKVVEKTQQFTADVLALAQELVTAFTAGSIDDSLVTAATTFAGNIATLVDTAVGMIDKLGELVTADVPGGLAEVLDKLIGSFQNAMEPAYQAGLDVGTRYIDGIVDAITAGLARVNEAMQIVAPPPPAPVPNTAGTNATGAGTRITIEAGAFQTTISNEMDAQEFEYRMLEVLRRLTEAA